MSGLIATDVGRAIAANIARVVLGADDAVALTVAACLAGGHVLVEDRPGVGKTLLAKALAGSIAGSFARVQGTADVLPSDLTGVAVYHLATDEWRFRPGPLFHNVVLVDEINRATPRAQSALLEAMAERHVTVDGATYALPDPFMVVATQNPYGDVGTFPLVAGQLDRFAVRVAVGSMRREDERHLLLGAGGEPALVDLAAVVSADQLRAARAAVAAAHVTAPVADYLLDLLAELRSAPQVRNGPSPRAATMVLRTAAAAAALDGRTFVTPDDVRSVAEPTLAHRLDAPDAHELVRRAVATTPVRMG